jgi:hypothetical protein
MSRLSLNADEPEPAPEVSGVSMEDSHAIIVVGASGDLAKKKTCERACCVAYACLCRRLPAPSLRLHRLCCDSMLRGCCCCVRCV